MFNLVVSQTFVIKLYVDLILNSCQIQPLIHDSSLKYLQSFNKLIEIHIREHTFLHDIKPP